MKRGDELQLEIIDAAFEEPEACKNNTEACFYLEGRRNEAWR